MSKLATEIYVWGSDNHGQLGLGHRYSPTNSHEKQLTTPKTCSFNIVISSVSCGEDFTFLLTSAGLVYGMGSNQYGKLGLN